METRPDAVDDSVLELLDTTATALEEVTSNGDVLETDDETAFEQRLENAAVFDLAESAREYVEDAATLLELTGLDHLPDGGEPDSLPNAILEGPPERVAIVRSVALLAKLNRQRDDTAAMRETLLELQDVLENHTAMADDADSALQSTLNEALDSFTDALTTARGSLPSLEDERDSEAPDDDTTETPEDGTPKSTDDSRSATSHGRYSTVAPAPSERADMNAVKRYSTIPQNE